MASVRQVQVTFDCALPPERQGAAFACVDPSGVGPRLFFVMQDIEGNEFCLD